MPVNSTRNQQRFSMGGVAPSSGLGPLNTTSFLFDDNEDKHLSLNGLTSPIAQAYKQLGGDDKFPTLRADGTSGMVCSNPLSYFHWLITYKLSANSAALDLANSKSPEIDSESWASGTRHRPSHQSMPQNDVNMYRPVLGSPPNERPLDMSGKKLQRHSMGVTFSDSTKFEQATAPASTASMSRPASLQSSYSTSDLPTVRNSSALTAIVTPPKTHAEQHFHNHNASLGRIPPGAVNTRLSRDLHSGMSTADPKREEKAQSALSNQSVLQASAAPFGPQATAPSQSLTLATTPNPTALAYNGAQMYSYGMHSYNVNQMSQQMALNNQLQAYQNQGLAGQYGAYGQYGRGQEGQHRGSTGRRTQNGDEGRFNNVPLESYINSLYDLCKDQHGCRYLQRKLEDGIPEQTQAIFSETRPHIIELMTGKTEFVRKAG